MENNFQKNFRVLMDEMWDEIVTWRRAEMMLAVYRDTAILASGNAEQRKIDRMKCVLEFVVKEIIEEIERAEQESV